MCGCVARTGGAQRMGGGGGGGEGGGGRRGSAPPQAPACQRAWASSQVTPYMSWGLPARLKCWCRLRAGVGGGSGEEWRGVGGQWGAVARTHAHKHTRTHAPTPTHTPAPGTVHSHGDVLGDGGLGVGEGLGGDGLEESQRGDVALHWWGQTEQGGGREGVGAWGGWRGVERQPSLPACPRTPPPTPPIITPLSPKSTPSGR